MKLVILGANGRTGRHVVRAALDEGIDVTSVVRHADKAIGIAHDRLKIVVGDPCDPAFLKPVFQGLDAAISTLGARRPTKAASSVYDRSAKAIVEAARETGVKRVLVTSTALLFQKQPLVGKLLRVIVPNMVASAKRMEDILGASDLNWTVARPGFLTDSNQEAFRDKRDVASAQGTSVSSRALANFLLSALKNRETGRGTYGVAGEKKTA